MFFHNLAENSWKNTLKTKKQKIANEQVNALKAVKGIGAKTAERVIVDLINNNNLSNNEKTAIITRLNNTKVIESENSFQEAENSNISYETSSYENNSSFND